jgi:hypothetical protein
MLSIPEFSVADPEKDSLSLSHSDDELHELRRRGYTCFTGVKAAMMGNPNWLS